ncbi:hypothetical protein [Nocardia cyriacigeorgica]|uniref:hypothetical protein n=1 Tax=Nocardia cyriacigeorgica TaxID=135487 RepID=UPI002458B8C0|nr:hypothetical protein [Nocardia cyriacigeorgica]
MILQRHHFWCLLDIAEIIWSVARAVMSVGATESGLRPAAELAAAEEVTESTAR